MIDTGRPRFSAAGEFLGYVGNVLDITDRKCVEHALHETQAMLSAVFEALPVGVAVADKDGRVLLSNHEMHEYLPTRMLPSLDDARSHRWHAVHPDGLETVANVRGVIERQVRQLSHLIDDLLDIARVTNGKVDIRRQALDLKGIVSNAVETSLPLIEKGDHEFSLKLHDAPLPVSADATRIAQVISNLLTNAAKYTPHGGKIRLAVERDGDDALISVADSGVGIPAESLESVFDMFSQVGRNMDHAQGGLGIGLALVRQLVALHGGSVTASSAGPGTGSTFVVRLPLDLASLPAGPHAEGAAAPPAPGKSLRILVADDNVDAAMTLVALLKLHGHELRIAHDGPQALAIAEQFRPELAFLDIGMPGMTGYEVARRLRTIPGLARSTIVAVSGWGAQDDLIRSEEAGFDMHFTKPVAPGRVHDFLSSLH